VDYNAEKRQYLVLFENREEDWVPKYPQEKLKKFDVEECYRNPIACPKCNGSGALAR
jgi:hypothetical protein